MKKTNLVYLLLLILIIGYAYDLYLISGLASVTEILIKGFSILICLAIGYLFNRNK